MLVLAFDTTSEQGGAGIYRDQDCLASLTNPGPANRYSVTLFEMVEHVLSRAKLALRDVELFAVSNGPGSFTGIRVGVAAAQGWAKAFDRPVVGVSVLEAMVEAARPETEWAMPVLDARRAEFYFGLFRRPTVRADFRPQGEARVLKPDALASFLEDSVARGQIAAPFTGVVRERDLAAQALRAALPASLRWKGVHGCLVDAISRLALRACRDGRLVSPAELDAFYIRRSDAELAFENLAEVRKKEER